MPATSAAFAGRAAFASVEVMPTVSVELTGFQFASTAFTVTENEEPAVRFDGLPVLPEAVPGAAVSPGIRIWSFVNAPALIVVAGLVFAVIAPLVTSVAVKVFEPAVLAVTERVLVPATRAALAGSVALASVEVMPTVSVELTGFQLASTALTVTLKRAARGLSRRGAGLARCGAGSRGLAREQDLELAEGSGGDRRRRARARRLAAVGLIRRRDGRRARGHERDREGLRPGDEGGRGRRDSSCVTRAEGDDIGRGDEVPVGVDGVDGDVEGCRLRSGRWACRSCRRRCRGRRSRRGGGSGAWRRRRR